MQLATWDGGLTLLIVRTHGEKLGELHGGQSPRGLSEVECQFYLSLV